MKIIQKIYKIVFAFGIVLFMGSCTEDFEETNLDPNAFNFASPENVFPGVVFKTLDLVGGDMNTNMFMNYASYTGGKGGQFPKFYYTESGVNRYWTQFYVDILKNNQTIIDNYSDRPGFANRVLIAKVWKSYVYSVMVSTFGGVPFDEALSTKTDIPYNTEEEIYVSILNMLKEAGDGLTTAGDKLGVDPVYGGDNAKWKKFANSLRLKIALRISTGFPALAETHVREVMAKETDMINTNADNCTLKWGLNAENASYNWRTFVFVQVLPSIYPYTNHHFILNLKSYEDPRLEAMIEKANKPLVIRDSLFAAGNTKPKVLVEYAIPYYGKPLGGNSTLPSWDLNANNNVLRNVADDSYSGPKKDLFMNADASYNVVTAAEVNLMKAEAKLKDWGGVKTAEAYYYDGIEASFLQYKITSGFATYKERPGIKWGTSSAGKKDLFGITTSAISADPMDKIVRQLWIALYNQGHDAWCLQKRTRGLLHAPHLAPDANAAAGGQYAEAPERMLYAPIELAVNPVAYKNAVAQIGTDWFYTPLKMNKPFTPVKWETVDAEFNQEFASYWYGFSVDDLIKANVPYKIIK
jgi:Starch-binding associating with outer membrane